MSNLKTAIKHAAESAVLRIIADGSWIAPDYNNRFKIPASMLAHVWSLVDVEKIKARMAERIEEEMADRIVNHMAAELATDIKKILSVKERREALRAVAREHMDDILKGKES
jgi:hypothetical protein